MPLRSTFTRFFQLEAASGLLLIAAAALALIINNSPLSHYYTAFLDVPVAVQIGALQIAKPSLLWINDGLMALFFLLIGLEVKRELLEGQLSKPSQVVLPGAAAIGGMVVPALIYWYINKDYPDALDGWAIPMATDIAFALGVLALLGKRVPVSLKLFLMTLAIIDDLGAIIVIAVFYSSELSGVSLMLAAACLVALIAMNRMGVIKVCALHDHRPDPLGVRTQKRCACHVGGRNAGVLYPAADQKLRTVALDDHRACTASVGGLRDPAIVCICQCGRIAGGCQHAQFCQPRANGHCCGLADR